MTFDDNTSEPKEIDDVYNLIQLCGLEVCAIPNFRTSVLVALADVDSKLLETIVSLNAFGSLIPSLFHRHAPILGNIHCSSYSSQIHVV